MVEFVGDVIDLGFAERLRWLLHCVLGGVFSGRVRGWGSWGFAACGAHFRGFGRLNLIRLVGSVLMTLISKNGYYSLGLEHHVLIFFPHGFWEF